MVTVVTRAETTKGVGAKAVVTRAAAIKAAAIKAAAIKAAATKAAATKAAATKAAATKMVGIKADLPRVKAGILPVVRGRNQIKAAINKVDRPLKAKVNFRAVTRMMKAPAAANLGIRIPPTPATPMMALPLSKRRMMISRFNGFGRFSLVLEKALLQLEMSTHNEGRPLQPCGSN